MAHGRFVFNFEMKTPTRHMLALANITSEMIRMLQKERIEYKIDNATLLVNLSNCFSVENGILGGTFSEKEVDAWRRKKFSRFDFNITSMKGTMTGSDGTTELNLTFSLIWIYRITIPSTILFFGIFQYLMVRSDQFEWKYLVMITSMEVLSILFYALLYRYQFKYDIDKYKKILNEVANGSNVC